MKGALTVVLFRLLTIGVFADGQEILSVMEGDSVTLMSKFKISTGDRIKWMFREIQIAKISASETLSLNESFSDRLQLDKQTGDLTISNIKATDAGEYKLKISSTRRSPPDMTFTVTVLSADRVNTKSVRKEDLLTLPTGLTDTQKTRDDVIRWRFGEQKSPIAEINKTAEIFSTYDGPDGIFRDRLQLDNQTGSLTITNTRTEHAGLYEVEITSTSSRYTVHHTKSFPVTIRGKQNLSRVKKGDTVTLYTDLTETQTDDQILWKFADHKVIAVLNGTPFDQSWDNTHLNPQTGDLTIKNIQTDHYGDYKLEITTRTMILHRKYQITVPDPGPDPDLSTTPVAGIVVGVVLLVAAAVAVAGGIFFHRKKSSQNHQSEENGGNHKKQDTEEEIKLSDDS